MTNGSDGHNVFAPPEVDESGPVSLTDDEGEYAVVRRLHINSEASVRSVGGLCILGSAIGLAIMLLNLSLIRFSGEVALTLLIQIVILWTGIWIRRLDPRGRILYSIGYTLLAGLVILGVLGSLSMGAVVEALVGMAISLLIPTAMLAALWTSKARVVMSEHYRKVVIPETPHIRYKTPVYVLILALLFFGIIVTAIILSVVSR